MQNYKLIIPGKSRRKQALSELLTSINEELTVSIEMPDSKLMAELVNNNDYIGYFILDEALEYNLIPLMLDVEMPYNYIGLIY